MEEEVESEQAIQSMNGMVNGEQRRHWC